MVLQMARTMIHGGQLVRTVRQHLGLTQEEVWTLTEISPRTYQRWESRLSEPSLSTVCYICQTAFNMSLLDAWLIADKTL